MKFILKCFCCFAGQALVVSAAMKTSCIGEHAARVYAMLFTINNAFSTLIVYL